MRKHVLMWWAAGGATLLGATLTYVMSRPALAPVVSRAQAGAARVRDSRLWEAGTWVSRKLSNRLADMLRKDRSGHAAAPQMRNMMRNAAFEEYRAAELTRLEHEEREFAAYLERLRAARDREEFENFMQDRRTR